MPSDFNISPDDIDWHDGNLGEIRLSGLTYDVPEIEIVVDLYSKDDRNEDQERVRFICKARSLISFRSNVDTKRLEYHSGPGNIYCCHTIRENGLEYLALLLFGGSIEICAQSVELRRAES